MDEFKPEDELKPDPSDRRTGRSRQIWMQTIVVRHAIATRVMSEKKKVMSPKKIQWTKSL